MQESKEQESDNEATIAATNNAGDAQRQLAIYSILF